MILTQDSSAFSLDRLWGKKALWLDLYKPLTCQKFTLKLLTDSLAILSSEKLVQLLTILCEQESFLICKLQLCSTSSSAGLLIGTFVYGKTFLTSKLSISLNILDNTVQ